MMSYESFKQRLASELRAGFPEGAQIEFRSFPRNNNVALDGLTIMEPGCNVSPTIYLNHYFKSYQEGEDIPSIAGHILRYYRDHAAAGSIDTSFFTDFRKMRPRIIFKLVHYGRNEELLRSVPHFQYLDLAIVFCCLFTEEPYANASTLIYGRHLDVWGVSADDLFDIAMENTPRLLPFRCDSLVDILSSAMGDGQDGEAARQPEGALRSPIPMYVLSNRQRFFGAGTILYKNSLRDASNVLGDSLYILPSSIHEVIVIPASRVESPELLPSLVREINETEVSADEVLSDNVYLYEKNSGHCGIYRGTRG